MKAVYVIHPYHSDPAGNAEKVRAICAIVGARGDLPLFAPFCFPWLDEADENDRRIGRRLGLKLLERCDEAESHGPAGAYSEGRDEEILHARKHGIPVAFIDEPEAA